MEKQSIALFVDEVNSFTPCDTEEQKRKLTRLINRIHAFTIDRCPFNGKDVMDAIIFAAKHHAGQRRIQNNDPYIFHPLTAALTLYEIGFCDYESIVIAILHDTREDSKKDDHEVAEEILMRFKSHIISKGVLLMTNPRKNRSKPKTIKKHIRSRHWQSLSAKTTENIHNIDTLGAVNKHSQREKILTTRQYFFKICDVIGKELKEKVRQKKLPPVYSELAGKLRERLVAALLPYRYIK